MHIDIATDSELDEIVALVNSAYRGDSSRQGWTTEADLIGGQRTDPVTLRGQLAEHEGARLLTLRDAPGAPLLGCVWLEPRAERVWYLGMLTVRPDLQSRGLGWKLLSAAEEHARARGARRMRISVIPGRDTLIAWYERCGYVRTGETLPFPYGDVRYGEPLREDLSFDVYEKELD